MKTISIMGCGWFGLPLAKALAEIGFVVKGSTTSTDKFETIKKAGAKPYLIKLGDDENSIKDFFKSDLLILNVPPGKSSHQDYLKNMTNLAKEVTCSEVEKVIYISSSSVYPNTGKSVVERDAKNIKTPRSGITMLEIEEVWRNLNSIKTNIVRFAGLYGPNRNPGRFLAGKTIEGGSNPVNMIHLDDCIGIVKRLIDFNQWGETFNACAPIHPSRKDFYLNASQQFGFESPNFQPPHETEYKIVSSNKLVKMTGYQFAHPDPIKSLDNL